MLYRPYTLSIMEKCCLSGLDTMARHIKWALQPLIDNGNKSCQSFGNSSSPSQVILWMRAGTAPCLSNISDTVSFFLARTLTDSGKRPRYIMLLLFKSWLCFAFDKTLLDVLRVGVGGSPPSQFSFSWGAQGDVRNAIKWHLLRWHARHMVVRSISLAPELMGFLWYTCAHRVYGSFPK